MKFTKIVINKIKELNKFELLVNIVYHFNN